MSPAAPTDAPEAPAPASKKKNNKKKKNVKAASNGEATKDQDRPLSLDVGVEDSGQSSLNTPNDGSFPDLDKTQVNGNSHEPASNGHAPSQAERNTPAAHEQDKPEPETNDAAMRLEAMSQGREALRIEVEQLRKALEDIQGKHADELSALKQQHTEDLSTAQGHNSDKLASLADGHTKEISTLKAELEESTSAREEAEAQYEDLLVRVNHIKESLGERLKADKEEIKEAEDQIKDLESENERLQKGNQTLQSDLSKLENNLHESSKELSGFRNRHNLSQQNWTSEREDLKQQIRHLKEEAEAAKEAMGDWEVLAMEERSIRETLTEKISEMEEQLTTLKESYEIASSESASQSQVIDGLRRALQEIQEARKRELREMVETSEEQLQSLKKIVQASDTRAVEAEAAKISLQTELDRLAPFEKEVKEKNLLIGKLRHEAIVLNEHLTKALRFLKKAKPEDNVDRQIVTNHFLHFLALDRTDPKKFQILQLIASLLNWTDEQKEQAGLARPGTSSSSLRLPVSPFHRTPSTPSLTAEFFSDTSTSKESLADLWTGFLERSAEEGSTIGSRRGSASSQPTRLDTPGGASKS